MLRPRVAALAFVVLAAACGQSQPTELRTAAAPQAAAPVDPTRAPFPTVPPATTSSTTTTTAPAPPPAPSTTTTAPAPPPAPRASSCGGWEDEVAAHFPAEQVPKACQVMGCETGWTFDPGIHNSSSSASGLFQFLDGTWTSTTGLPPPAAAYPGEQQIAAGAALWSSSGWGPWSCA